MPLTNLAPRTHQPGTKPGRGWNKPRKHRGFKVCRICQSPAGSGSSQGYAMRGRTHVIFCGKSTTWAVRSRPPTLKEVTPRILLYQSRDPGRRQGVLMLVSHKHRVRARGHRQTFISLAAACARAATTHTTTHTTVQETIAMQGMIASRPPQGRSRAPGSEVGEGGP